MHALQLHQVPPLNQRPLVLLELMELIDGYLLENVRNLDSTKIEQKKGINDQCKLIYVIGGSCTTDRTKFIPQSTCSSYIEAGCFNGKARKRLFSLPVRTTTGNKS
ncbi:unnamed protein product [Paramecium primaurelia]|uniref:Uncharacterized protein n=1 Tax=Paramecium primaurelia TaxID=5886 RepID=A0A8S1QFY4_PARPR|nr:unnamed protein product [Paramecium primaurelia]